MRAWEELLQTAEGWFPDPRMPCPAAGTQRLVELNTREVGRQRMLTISRKTPRATHRLAVNVLSLKVVHVARSHAKRARGGTDDAGSSGSAAAGKRDAVERLDREEKRSRREILQSR